MPLFGGGGAIFYGRLRPLSGIKRAKDVELLRDGVFPQVVMCGIMRYSNHIIVQIGLFIVACLVEFIYEAFVFVPFSRKD